MSAAWWWAWGLTTVLGVLWDTHATDAAGEMARNPRTPEKPTL